MACVERAGGGAVWTELSRWANTTAGRRLAKTLLAAALLGVGLKLWARRRRHQRRQRWSQAGKDVVVLHQFERGTNMPNLSPFALKLETFLRMANIQYVVDTEEPQGVRGKCPWITINGEELSDSELIMDYLTKHFNNPIPEQLTPAQHGVGRAVQVMLDEHTTLAVGRKRRILEQMGNSIDCFLKVYRSECVFKKLFVSLIKKKLYVRGMSEYREEEALFFLYRELRALEDVMGDRPFLLADAPSTYDAAVFAQLTQVLLGCAPEVERYVRENHAVLVGYHKRMKAKYWPDWQQCRA
ncbi:failed axon connections homolog [Amphibalanus amphitrite]|uniref:failed axon connections homolog n=1 Tax=Amphibalanus amphitrite TaxID=1232801 RepID=UPI001C9133CF|nr:failed axon connections homolog [Amphibalanus amphitrite]